MLRIQQAITILLLVVTSASLAAPKDEPHPLSSMPLREIGPAFPSGRVVDFAVHPQHKNIVYAATASGGLWKSTDGLTTWNPLFDAESSYSLGVVEIDPSNPLTVWAGSGENNSQRSVAFGDGVYKSTDGGQSWTNMGLKNSGHIGQIWIDPNDSDNVLVAAIGPLWSEGGDRGLYRTTDGGKTWARILNVDEHTGINEFVVDPRDPNVIVAASYQRRRHVWVLINGGPGGGIHRTTDGGKTWQRIESALPSGDIGRVGLASAPSAPDTLYAIIEASDDDKGVYRSTDFGQNWEKRSGHMTTSPQYYNELLVDPHNAQRVFSLDTFTQVSDDGGASFRQLSTQNRHVDDHALWIDPDNTAHLIIGGDGGIYETWNLGDTWRHVDNLPIVQFYRIQPDNAAPFYNVCGGTQDNNSLCGPSRTAKIDGITNADWRVAIGGDGYKPQIDPRDPNIVYAQYQYGGLARFDKRSGERVWIVPQPRADEPALNWNWNSPLLLSPHAPERLYYGAEKLYRSDDRGNSWEVISPNLTQNVDRNTLKVMGRVWSVDSIAKNDSTSRYGSLIGLSESPIKEGLIYTGSDDGMISVTEDGGKNWRSVNRFKGVPKMAYIDDVVASMHSEDVAYAVVDNHKKGDHKPYVLRTKNRGKSWQLISGNLPERGAAHTVAEDHLNPNLLFVGTEFGLYFTQDGGDHWHKFDSLPTIAVRDLEIQRRESDLVIGTFGRGIWVLDDYSPLRAGKPGEATVFPVRDSWLYIQADQFGGVAGGSRGSSFWRAENPAYGAVFSYYLPEAIETSAEKRRKSESEIAERGEDTPYPEWQALRAEDDEIAPSLNFVIRDQEGNVIRRVAADSGAGFHRVNWDMRFPAPDAVNLNPDPNPPYWLLPPMGPLATPGQYTVELVLEIAGEAKGLSSPQPFVLRELNSSPELTDDRNDLLQFQQEAADLYRRADGLAIASDELDNRIAHLREALRLTAADTQALKTQLDQLDQQHKNLKRDLFGDESVTSRNEAAPWSFLRRIDHVYTGQLEAQAPVSKQYRESLKIARSQFATISTQLRELAQQLDALDQQAGALGAPWVPGRR